MNLVYRFFRLDLKRTDDRNAWYLCLEILWASFLSAAATFNSAYAVRLEATSFQVGLLSSIPALMAIITAIPAGWFLQRRSNPKKWILGSLAIHRAGFLLVAAVPWILLPFISQGFLVVIILILISIPANFFNVGFIPMLGETTPEDRRAAVFSARSVINNAVLMIFTFLFGQWLKHIAFPVNYQAMYLVGFITSMMSNYYLFKIVVPDRPVQPQQPRERKSFGIIVRQLKEFSTEHSAFIRITRNTLMHGIGLWAASPLYVLYYLRERHASEDWLGLLTTLTAISVIAGNAFYRWLIRKIGEQRTLRISIMIVGIYPILAGISPTLTPILFAACLNGFNSAGVNLSHFNTLLKSTPEHNRPGYTAIYMTVMNVGAFIMPLVGVTVADQIGLPATLIGCGVLSILGSSSFWFSPVKPKNG
ncbi:MAG TPA: MFS transporter [Anaerolineaceae bacterium]